MAILYTSCTITRPKHACAIDFTTAVNEYVVAVASATQSIFAIVVYQYGRAADHHVVRVEIIDSKIVCRDTDGRAES
jgi:hypothetical protein